MANPTHTVRTTPTGYKLPDGYKTTVAFSRRPAVSLWEKTVKIPGIDGGEPIDTSTMHNAIWRTKTTRSLKTSTESTMKCAFDPDVINDILFLINDRSGSATYWLPDGSWWDFYAALYKFEWDPFEEGKFPEATASIAVLNWDNVNGVEAGPVFNAAPGT